MTEIRYDLMGKKKIWYIISLLVIIPGIISMVFQGLNLGIDFTGGNLLHLKFNQAADTQQVRTVLGEFGLEGSLIQTIDNREYIIRTTVIDQDTVTAIMGGLRAEIGELEILRNELVGPVIGKELTIKALYALAIATVIMVVYITYRFEFSFALAAIIAIIHDVLIILSVFSIFQMEINSYFMAAILTIIGYSVNDTIVIFDRIRENLRYHKGGTLEQLLNSSVWQTMARSINTALTVVFVLLPMMFFGGETTKLLVLALLIGVISGAYSSIFIASPVWLEIKAWEKRHRRVTS
ncbi:MAG: protein translocase subunit SecF [Clostridia bacterium]|nr:protein translocase subunit SecF [Clostridia bacterium]